MRKFPSGALCHFVKVGIDRDVVNKFLCLEQVGKMEPFLGALGSCIEQNSDKQFRMIYGLNLRRAEGRSA